MELMIGMFFGAVITIVGFGVVLNNLKDHVTALKYDRDYWKERANNQNPDEGYGMRII